MSDPTKGAGPGRRPRNDLVALGAAAVLSVYSAGWLRTQDAARMFEGDELERSPGASPLAPAPPPGPGPQGPPAGSQAPAGFPAVTGAVPASSDPAASAAGSGGVPPGAPSEAVSGGAGGAAVVDGALFRDGVYRGLGRSRHGNIEATLEILEGRIVSATITTCRTLYPCSRIDEVVPQVVERQDSWVDNVSGATVSVTAFYRAVVQALKQAQ